MTRDEAAAELNGKQYLKEGSREFFRDMEEHGLVAIFGASDDLMEIDGAVSEEVGAYNGGKAYFNKDGLVENKCVNDRCPYHAKALESAVPVHAIWDDGGFSWRYETTIPHSKFVIKEDDENYCEGIVFALADVPSGRATT